MMTAAENTPCPLIYLWIQPPSKYQTKPNQNIERGRGGAGEDPDHFYWHLKLELYHVQNSSTDTLGIFCTSGISGKISFSM